MKHLRRKDSAWGEKEKDLIQKERKFYCIYFPKLREVCKKLPKTQMKTRVKFSCFYFPQLKKILKLLKKKLSQVKNKRKKLKKQRTELLRKRKSFRNSLLDKINCGVKNCKV